MPIPLNVEMLAHAYDYLACQKPFASWNLPPAEEIKFKVIRKPDRFAHYQRVGATHIIAISSQLVGRHESLITSLSHEMIHLHQELTGTLGKNPHDAAFQKLADKVCRIHEFDRLTF